MGQDYLKIDDVVSLKPIAKSDGPPPSGQTPFQSPIKDRQNAADNPDGRRALINIKKK